MTRDLINQPSAFDSQRVEAMARTMMVSVKANSQLGPTGRGRWYEAANAVAIVTAVLIAGAGVDRDQAVCWIADAVGQQLASIDRGELPLSGQ